jgi:chloramphenicol O-acetyltransferase type A
MRVIDFEAWDRKEHFGYFLKKDLPFYNLSFDVDITGLNERVKDEKVSLNNALIFLTMETLNGIPNFLFRVEDGRIIQHDRLHPYFAYLRKGEELFRMVAVEFKGDLRAFDASAKAAMEGSAAYFDLGTLAGRSDIAVISALPWIPFSGIDHTLSLNKEDGVPRISWGMFRDEGGRTLLPYNIQANHIFVDGIHIGKFYQDFQGAAAKLARGT